jgi:transcriptional regulator with XRE-family HTH domain
MTSVDQLPSLARNVLRHRRHRRLTQAELARRSRLSRKTISNIERGEVPSLETLLALARGLEMSPAKLIDDPHQHGTLTRHLDQIRRFFERASARTREKLAELVCLLTKGREAPT